MPKLKDEFDAIGVSLMDADGNFRSTYDILVDLSSVWGNLNDLQKSNITYLAAGLRQSDTFNAILTNTSTLLSSYTTSLDSAGSAAKENAIYMESIAAKTELFTKALKDLWTNAINSDSIKGIVDLGTGIIKLADNLDLVNVALSVFFAWMIKVAAIQIAGWATSIIKYIGTIQGQIYALTGATATLGATVKATAAAIWSAMSSTVILAAIAAIIYGTTKAIERLNELKETYESLKEESQSTLDTFIKNKDSILEMIASLKKAKEGTAEYFSISNKLAELLPEVVDYIDEEGNAHLKTSGAIDQHIDALDELSNSYRESLKVDFQEEIALLEELQNKYDALNKQIKSYQNIFGTTPVIFGTSINEGNIELTPELQFQQDYLDYQAELIYQQIRNALVDQAMAAIDVDSEMSGALSAYISSAIADMDVSSSENIAIVGGKALEISQMFNDAFTGISFDTVFQNALDYLNGFWDKQLDIDNPDTYAVYVTLFDYVAKLGEQYGWTREEVEIFTHALINSHNAAEDATDANETLIQSLDDLASAYKSAYDEINKLKKIQEEINKAGELTPEIIAEIAESYPELLPYMSDVQTAQQAINDAIGEYEDAALKAYAGAMIANGSYMRGIINNNTTLQNALASIYGADAENWSDLAEGKFQTDAALVAALGALWGKYANLSKQQVWEQLSWLAQYGETSSATYKELKALYNLWVALESSYKSISSSFSSSLGSGSSTTDDLYTFIDALNQLFDIQENNLDILIKQKKELLDALEEQYEYEDKITALQEAQAKLANVQAEHNVKLYNPESGQFEWVSDPQALADAQSAVDNAQQDYDRYVDKKAIQDQIDVLEDQKNAIKDFASAVNLLTDSVKDQINSWNELVQALSDAGIAYNDVFSLVDFSNMPEYTESSGYGNESAISYGKASEVSGTLKLGSSGDGVKAIQSALTGLGYYAGEISGSFDAATKAAVKAFQGAMGITADGIVGTNTKKKFALNGYAEGGAVFDTAPAMLHGSSLNPEYVYSASDVKIMSKLPQLIANLLNKDSGDSGFNIENLNVYANTVDQLVRGLKQRTVLSKP